MNTKSCKHSNRNDWNTCTDCGMTGLEQYREVKARRAAKAAKAADLNLPAYNEALVKAERKANREEYYRRTGR